VRIPNGPERVYAAKMARQNAYDMHRDVYDLHRKFGSEMAAKGSQNIDRENPSLSGIWAFGPHPCPPAAGVAKH
ncbi:MAG: hypothetical protein ACI3ZO_02650, partial [Candidatus Cryptobacteroides sp.]